MKNPHKKLLVKKIGLTILAVFAPFMLSAQDESDEDIFELSPFEVKSSQLEGYIASNAVSATKIDAEIRNLPVSVDVVTKDLIEDYGARSLKEMVDLAGNITTSEKPNTLSTQFVLRGFPTYVNLRNGMARVPTVYGSNIERIEIVRGPTAVLYGLTDPGGAVNVITRQPERDAYTSLEYTFGSDKYNRADLQWNQPLHQKVLTRVDASWLDREGFRDHEQQRSRFLSTANIIVLSPRISISLEGEYREMEDTPGSWWPRIIEPATNTFKMADIIPSTFNANIPGYNRKVENFVGTATLNFKINDNAFYRGSFNYYTRDFERLSASSTRVTAGRFLSRYSDTTNQESDLNSFYQQLNWNLLKSNYELRMVFGHEYKDSKLDRIDTRSSGATQPAMWDLTDPDSWDMSLPDVANFTVSDTVDVNNLENEFYGVGHLTFGENERFSLLGGVRNSNIKVETLNRRDNSILKTDTNKWSYQFGGIYRPIKRLGLYANYSESFRFISNILRRNMDRSLSPFDPIEGTGAEIGAKLDLLDEKLSLNISLYDIEQTGVRRVVQVEDDFGEYSVDLQTGVEQSRGFDFTVNWNVLRNWQLIGSLAYADAETVSNEQSPLFEGRILPNNPEWMAQLTTRYSFTTARLKGLTVGATWKYVDETLAYNTLDDFILDDYSIVNAFIQYRWDIKKDVPVILRLNLYNAFDEFYFPDTSGPGLPRSVRFSAMIKF